MKNALIFLVVVLFLFGMAGAIFAHPLGGPPGQIKKGEVVEKVHPQGGPPGLMRKAFVSQPATLTVVFSDGYVEVVEGVTQGMTVQFTFAGTGTIIDMVAEQNGRITYWSGQGSEYADMSEYDEALWQVVWTSGGAFGRGRQVLTIGYAEGFLYEVEEPIDEEPPIDDEEPVDEEPVDEEPIDEEPDE